MRTARSLPYRSLRAVIKHKNINYTQINTLQLYWEIICNRIQLKKSYSEVEELYKQAQMTSYFTEHLTCKLQLIRWKVKIIISEKYRNGK